MACDSEGRRAAKAERGWLLVGGSAVVVAYLALLPAVPLLEPDEGRYAEIPREMLASGDFVTPRLNGLLYFAKPPLYYWLTAASISALGLNEFASRLPSALAGLGTVALVYLLGSRLGGRRAGAWAAGVAASSPLFMLLAHVNSIDMTLTFFLTATLACFAVAWEAPRRSRAWLCWYGVFAGAALAVMTKGLIGIVIPGGVIAVAIAASGRWRALLAVPWLGGSALFALLAVPWHVLVALRNPSFLETYFVYEHFLRYTTSVAARTEPLWYFPAVLLAGCLPWTGVALAALLERRPAAWLAAFRRRPGLALLAAWFVFVLAFFSASHSKLASYMLPAMPPLAVLLGLHLDRLAARGRTLAGAVRLANAAAATAAAAMGAGLVVAASGRVHWLGERQQLEPLLLLAGLAVIGLASPLCLRREPAVDGRVVAQLFALSLCLSCALWAAVAVEGPARSSKAVAEVLRPRLRSGDLLFSFADYHQGLPVYLRRTTGVVAHGRDLAFGLSQASAAERAERFPSAAGLRDRWRSDAPVFVVADLRNLAALRAALVGEATEVYRGHHLVLLANRSAASR